MSQSLRPLVRNRLLFREVNERVRDALARQEGPIEFLCECGDSGCVDTVLLDVPAYERVRAQSSLFLVASGHEDPDFDRVVDQGLGYLLVERATERGRGVASDPRTRGEP